MCNNHKNMSTTRVLSVLGEKEPFQQTTMERRELRPNDILINIKFSGICHSDIHSAFDE
jgi:alcohol dehydrogenase (NADP+)